MGHDKAALRLDGRSLLERAAMTLSELCDEILVASGDGDRFPGPWRQVADAIPDVGPLAGLVAGLAAASNATVAVLAVDLPRPSAPLLAWLAAHRGQAEVVVPRVDGRLQPLHAVYTTAAHPWLASALRDDERSLTAVLRGHPEQVLVVGPEAWRPVTDAGFARNVNVPADAHAAGVSPPDQRS